MGLFAGFLIFLIVASCSCIIGEGRNKIDIFDFGGGKDGEKTFNVVDFGAVGDGQADDTNAFSKAWEAICRGDVAEPILQISEGKTFLLQPMKFEGPCRSKSVQIQISGKIAAPESLNGWKSCPSESWLFFSGVTQLSIYGSGQIDGQGSAWWADDAKPIILNESKMQCDRPRALLFHQCDNLKLSGLTHINSPKAHISINHCNFVSVFDTKIIAPEDSPNTDGIDISESTNVDIRHSFIGTGDDCVAINGGSSNISITNVACGPGHGISVGSLGKDGAYDTVEDVHVKNVTFNRTQNGARIKTWEGGSGYARRIFFEDITLIATENPIIIDQHYCNGEHDCKNSSKAMKVSDVTYNRFHGTSADDKAIVLDCIEMGCTNIVMEHVDITSSDPSKKTSSYCKNAQGKCSSTVPSVSCLQSTSW